LKSGIGVHEAQARNQGNPIRRTPSMLKRKHVATPGPGNCFPAFIFRITSNIETRRSIVLRLPFTQTGAIKKQTVIQHCWELWIPDFNYRRRTSKNKPPRKSSQHGRQWQRQRQRQQRPCSDGSTATATAAAMAATTTLHEKYSTGEEQVVVRYGLRAGGENHRTSDSSLSQGFVSR
jgi:hypothetical protein